VTIPANFDRVARVYRWLEYMTFGPWLERCRSAQLPHLTGARRVLLLGDGDGRFLERLLAANPALTADVIDSSQSMLTILDKRIRRSGPQARRRISLHHADALQWNPIGSYDLIVSHFFLDCFFPYELEEVFDRVLPHALPGARWVISEFAIPRNPFAGSAYSIELSVCLPGCACVPCLNMQPPCFAAAWCPATTAVSWQGSYAPRFGPVQISLAAETDPIRSRIFVLFVPFR
jgi:ubiquinone/menaquinone biosynthesis C-methylase UbiE